MCNFNGIGVCRNTIGSFKCECPLGYKVNDDKTQCEDINECLQSPCVNGECANTFGSFRCVCKAPGTSLDHKTQRVCIDTRKAACWTRINSFGQCEYSLKEEVTMLDCCSTIGQAWGSPCTRLVNGFF